MTRFKDYYHILGLEKSATADEIKRAYRRMALQFHPDRNPGNKQAEETFKQASEAYAVLIDPVKRAQFDRRQPERPEGAPETGPSDEQTDYESFASVYARHFRDLAEEFEKMGFPFDEKFFDRVFFGSRGFYFGGVFFTGPFGGRVHRGAGPAYRTSLSKDARARARPAPAPEARPRLERGFWSRAGGVLKNAFKGLLSLPAPEAAGSDINFNLKLTPEQAGAGAQVQLVYQRDGKPQRVAVRVPPGTKNGARLRLKKMGRHQPDGQSGDLFLHVKIG
ncbi:MAG: DnaJ domain-containing protein [Proteobacteria bacterium]|nr:DnaJ domain-containing protein [Pseudomonadota bacterium]